MFALRKLICNINKLNIVNSYSNRLLINKNNVPGCKIILRYKSDDELHSDDDERYTEEYEELVNHYFSYGAHHSCFIIHPYVKWGSQKVRDTTSEQQLEECAALIRTLESWRVWGSVAVPLDNLDKKKLFSSGKLAELKQRIRRDANITAVFINVGNLKMIQKEELEVIFGVPIFDRYNIVMMILKMHAISKHAKLQVSLAENLYVQSRLKKGMMDNTGTVYDTKKLILHSREMKIKKEIQKLRLQREQQRNSRKSRDFPIVAVVGYTNSGKTSLIKCLSDDKHLQPKNQLFATLDVTLHAGKLPSSLEVLYVDTVGFISNIPTTLIECFVVTLEDALYSDLILHVEDLSSQNLLHQRNHVKKTLNELASTVNDNNIFDKVLTVGNKCDLVEDNDTESKNDIRVSAKTGYGIDELREKIEECILKSTNRNIITVKIPIGGNEIRWLNKNSTVFSTEYEPDSQFQKVKVIITPAKLQQFKHYFVHESRNK